MPPISITFHTRSPLPGTPPNSALAAKKNKSSGGTTGTRRSARGSRSSPYMYFSFDHQPNRLISLHDSTTSSSPIDSLVALSTSSSTTPIHPNTNHVTSPRSSSSKTTPTPPPSTTLLPAIEGVTVKATTKGKRGKPTYVPPPPSTSSSSSSSSKIFTLTPLLQPIVDRCFVKAQQPNEISSTSTPGMTSPQLHKRSTLSVPSKKKQHTPSTTTTPTILYHPYSRNSDTRNDRSNVPSPREIIRAERLEIEKLRAKEESAAAARAAAALKRKKGGKSRVTSKNNSVARSVSPKKDKSDEDKEEPSSAGATDTRKEEEASVPPPSLPSNPLPTRVGLKRTRSTGLGISTTGPTAGLYGVAGPAVSSPLRAVTVARSDDDEHLEKGHLRKKSRLGDGPFNEDPSVRRRATTGSPTERTVKLPSTMGIIPQSTEPRTEPISQTETLPRHLGPSPTHPTTSAVEPDVEADNEEKPVEGRTKTRRASAGMSTNEKSETMRRVASAGAFGQGNEGSPKTLARNLAALENGRDRSRREVTVPARLRDYEMKAAV